MNYSFTGRGIPEPRDSDYVVVFVRLKISPEEAHRDKLELSTRRPEDISIEGDVVFILEYKDMLISR